MASLVQSMCTSYHQLAPYYKSVEEAARNEPEELSSNSSDQSDSEAEESVDVEADIAEGNSTVADMTVPNKPEFARELLVFYLFGKIHPKHDHLRSEFVKRRLAEVQQLYRNIPSILHFTFSTVAMDQIGVAASQTLPKETVLGPYSGQELTGEEVQTRTRGQHNEGLWEVHDTHGVSGYIDGSDPKYGNWMSVIQCARSKDEQNLKLTQRETERGVQLYYVAIRDIHYGQELLVWYDTDQVQLHCGLPVALKRINHNIDADEEEIDKVNSPLEPDDELLTVEQPQTDINAESTCTDDSGMYTDTSDLGLTQTLKPPRDASLEGETPRPPLLTPLRVVTDDVPYAPEMSAIPVKPLTHLTTYTYIQAPIAPTYRYIGIRDNSYSPQLSPCQLAPQLWQRKQRSRSRSPIAITVETAGESSENWKMAGSRKNELLYGMFTRSDDGSRWRCTRCERHFNSQGSLRAHARIHTGERPYKCKFCSRTFCQASTLRSHERLHTGEKPFKCNVCGRAFTQSAGLRSHLKTHIGGAGSRFE